MRSWRMQVRARAQFSLCFISRRFAIRLLRCSFIVSLLTRLFSLLIRCHFDFSWFAFNFCLFISHSRISISFRLSIACARMSARSLAITFSRFAQKKRKRKTKTIISIRRFFLVSFRFISLIKCFGHHLTCANAFFVEVFIWIDFISCLLALFLGASPIDHHQFVLFVNSSLSKLARNDAAVIVSQPQNEYHVRKRRTKNV